jgi:Flp pilus assembly protein TadD
MLDRFKSDEASLDIQLVVRTCVLAADATNDFTRVVTLAEQSLAARPKDHNSMLMLGAALYRAGRYDDAVRALLKSAKARGKEDAFNDLFLAMSYLRMGDPVKAQSHVQQAARAISQAPKSGTVGGFPNARLAWSDQMELLLLRNEVQAMLKS